MTTIETQIPDSLYNQVKSLAERESISVDQLVNIALAAQVSAWLTKDYLAERAARGTVCFRQADATARWIPSGEDRTR